MENNNNEMEAFNQFAEDKLKNHLAELDTRYYNEQTDKETLQQGYKDHQQTFNMELEEQIRQLTEKGSDENLTEKLNEAKKAFVDKLNSKQ